MSNVLHLGKGSNRSQYKWTPYHLTTMNFGRPQVQFARFLYPSDKLNLNCSSFFRTLPLAFPAYVRGRHVVQSTFVPIYQVDEYAEYAFSGVTQIGSIKTAPLTFRTADLMTIFKDGLYSDTTDAGHAHFCLANSSRTATTYYKLNERGRSLYKIIKDLGYEFVSEKIPTTNIPNISKQPYFFNAYALLCYAKYINDIILPAQYKSVRRLTSLLEQIKHRHSDVFETGSGMISTCLNIDTLRSILTDLFDSYVMFNSDYFTTAWRCPNQPIDNGSTMPTTHQFADSLKQTTWGNRTNWIEVNNTSVAQSENNTWDNEYIDDNGFISSRLIENMVAFDKWLRRNNYIGQNVSKRVLSMFGVTPEQTQSHDAELLRSKSYPIEIGDVTSYSDTSSDNGGAQLGQYAGKAFCKGDFNVNFKSSDYGMFFVTSYIVADPLYSDGVFHENLIVNNEEYYQPEYDQLQAVPISMRELISSYAFRSSDDVTNADHVFGFQPNYEWLRSHRDSVSGDFLIFPDYKAWFAQKSISSLVYAQDTQVLSYSKSSFNQLFQDTNDDYDKFICSFQFDIDINRPIISSSQATGLTQGDIDIEKFGNV